MVILAFARLQKCYELPDKWEFPDEPHTFYALSRSKSATNILGSARFSAKNGYLLMFGATHEHKNECKHSFSVHGSLGSCYHKKRDYKLVMVISSTEEIRKLVDAENTSMYKDGDWVSLFDWLSQTTEEQINKNIQRHIKTCKYRGVKGNG